MWDQDGALCCLVEDDGPPESATVNNVSRPRADGNAAAEWPCERNHGLWLIRLLADQMSILSGRDGTRATVVFMPGR